MNVNVTSNTKENVAEDVVVGRLEFSARGSNALFRHYSTTVLHNRAHFCYKAEMACGGLGKSALAQPRMRNIWYVL